MKVTVVLVAVITLPCYFALPNQSRQKLSESLKWKPTMLEDIFGEHHRRLNKGSRGNQHSLTGFSWNQCDKSTSLVQINSLTVQPDPLVLPGTVTVSADFQIKKELVKPLKAVVDMKVAGFKLPCVGGVGSCTYDDVCQLLDQTGSQCPDPLQKIGCKCPFIANTYSLAKTSFSIQASIPSETYSVLANVTQGDTQVLCLQLDFTVQ